LFYLDKVEFQQVHQVKKVAVAKHKMVIALKNGQVLRIDLQLVSGAIESKTHSLPL
jgi:coenzyme F420-reducing hydrogenase beta subunit